MRQVSARRPNDVKKPFHEMETERRAAGDVSVLGRTLRVVEAFGDDDFALSLAELSARTEPPKSTVHRIAHGLVERGWLEPTDEQFALGIRLSISASTRNCNASTCTKSPSRSWKTCMKGRTRSRSWVCSTAMDVIYLAKIGGHRRATIAPALAPSISSRTRTCRTSASVSKPSRKPTSEMRSPSSV
jgi:hypothetical protein